MNAILLFCLAALSAGAQDVPASLFLDQDGFRREFEAAFDADDVDRIEALVVANPTRFGDLFQSYARVWIRVRVEPSAEELLAFEHARVLAEAVDSALDAPGLLEKWEALDGFDDEARREWQEANALYQQGAMRQAAEQFEQLGDSYRAALAWFSVGETQSLRGGLQEAAEFHERALALRRPLGNPREIADSCNNLGLCYTDLGQYEKAVEFHQQSLALRESLGNSRDVTASLNNLGISYRRLGQVEKAIDHYERAQALTGPLGDPLDRARDLSHLGNCYDDLGQVEKALELHQRALALRESSDDPELLALSLMSLGSCFTSLGQFEKALELHQRSLALREPLGNSLDISTSLMVLASSYRRLGRSPEAIELLQRALNLAEPLGNPGRITDILARLGRCYQDLGQYEKALRCLQRTHDLEEPLGDPWRTAANLTGLGACYEALGQYEKAIQYHDRALPIFESVGTPRGIATCLTSLGICYHFLEQFETAAAHYRRALALHESMGDPRGIATSLNGLGSCLVSLGHLEEALDSHQQALALDESGGSPANLAVTLNNIGYCYERLGQLEKAIDFYERALELKEPLGDPASIFYSRANLADCYQALGQFEQAVEHYRRAFTLLAPLSLRSLSEQEQSRFRADYQPSHEAALRAALAGPQHPSSLADAFWITESLRNRAMLGSLAAGAERLLADADPTLVARRQQLVESLETARLQLETAFETPELDTEEGEAKVATLEHELREVTGKLRRSSPRLMQLAIPEPVGVDEIRRQVLAPGQGLLQFVVAEEQSFLWLLTHDDLRLCALPGEAELRDGCQQLRRALLPGASRQTAFLAPARRLHEALLEPIADRLDSLTELIIVADGFLGYLPFEALLTQTPDPGEPLDLATLPYLIRSTSISYAPSASFLAFVAAAGQQATSWKKDALLLGDPLYASEQVSDAASPSRAVLTLRSFQRLRGTREEVTEIASELLEDEEADRVGPVLRGLGRSGALSGTRFDLYLGNEVTEARLKSDLTGYRIVHLATHGYIDPEYPWFSGMVLSSRGDQVDSDGFLNLLEIGTLELDAQLVFLSACETGTGEVLRSEGVQSAARSFLIAGSQAVIATQWSVRDDVASTMARVFYRELFDGQSPAAALRQAKLSLLDGSARGLLTPGRDRGVAVMREGDEENVPANPQAHPSFWAPFVIFGGRGTQNVPR